MAIQKIPNTLIADNAVTASKIANGTLTADDIAANSITAAKISASTSPTFGGIDVTGTATMDGLTVNSSEVLFDNTGGDFTLKLNTNAVSDKNEIIMGDSGTPLAKFGVGGTANDIITGSDGQDFNIGTAGGGRAINFSTDNFASVEMKLDGGNVGIGTSNPGHPLNVVDSGELQAEFSGYSHASAANNSRAASGSIRLGNGGGATGLLIDYTDQGQTVGLIKNEYVASTSSELRLQSPFLSFYTGESASEAMRITSTGGVEVGDGTNYGYLKVISDNAVTGYFDRRNSDGTILEFRKDDSSVGSIGTINDSLYIASTYSTDSGLRFSGSTIHPCDTSGNPRDDAINLGYSAGRFQDLYLSGGAYLGGTGSANKLDDYEEGTLTMTNFSNVFGNSSNHASDYAIYTKIGNLVHIQGRITFSIGSSGRQGFTFVTPIAMHSSVNTGMLGTCSAYDDSTNHAAGYILDNTGSNDNQVFLETNFSGTSISGVTYQMTYRTA